MDSSPSPTPVDRAPPPAAPPAPVGGDGAPPNRARQLLILLAAALLVAAAGWLLIMLTGALYGLAVPPPAPIPPNSTLLNQQNFTYGSDAYLYDVSQLNSCDVTAFYLSEGFTCEQLSTVCGEGGGGDQVLPSLTRLAICVKTQNFSVHAVRFVVEINADTLTRLVSVRRNVLWGGQVSESTLIPNAVAP
jgi:hypothetical protein